MKKPKNVFVLIFIWIIVILLAMFIYKAASSKPAPPAGNYIVQQISHNATNNVASTPNETADNTIAPKIKKSSKGLPILMYHCFYDKKTNTKSLDNNFTEISAFEQQMKYLSDNNYYYPTWNEVYQFVEAKSSLPSKSVVVTIDDGDVSFFQLAVPILKKYNVKATSFLITSFVDSKTIAEFKSPILDFESHSNNMHRAGKNGKGIFLSLSHDNAYKDLMASQNLLGSHQVFCYPFGDYNTFTKNMLAETGYKLAVTTKPGRVYPGEDPLALPRVRMSRGDTLDQFISRVK
ncbi:MAG: polysaccharide deacetylase family protein [Firmicutes bacterium]|nr:polysaccharide deacetylase family protein [Bacillota bacterium]